MTRYVGAGAPRAIAASTRSVSEPSSHAIKLLVSHMYDQRSPEIAGMMTTKLKLGLESLLNPYRIVSFR